MPSPISFARRVPWVRTWTIALWLVSKGRERVNDNLTAGERHELRKIVTRSKGRPSNLHPRDKTRLKNIVKKAVTGR